MAIEAHTTTIDGVTYTLAALSADKGLEVSGHIFSILGEAAAHADADGNIGISMAVAAVMSRMSDPKTHAAIRMLLADVYKEIPGKPLPGMKVDFRTEFAQNYGTMVRLVAWAIEFNFVSFLGARGEVQGLVEKIRSTEAKSTGATSLQ